MTAPDLVKVRDYWGDFGTVETGQAKAAGKPAAAVVNVQAWDMPYDGAGLDFTPSQAREFAAAIVAAADSIVGARPPFVVDDDGDGWVRQDDGSYRMLRNNHQYDHGDPASYEDIVRLYGVSEDHQ